MHKKQLRDYERAGIDAEKTDLVAAYPAADAQSGNVTLRRGETVVHEVVVSVPSTLKGSYIAGRGSVF